MSVKSEIDRAQEASANATARLGILLKGYEKISSQKQQVMLNACLGLEDEFINQLRDSWKNSGLHVRSGDLARAVASSTIVVRPNMIQLQMPSGLSKRLYVYANALNYGAVHGGGGKRFKAKLKKSGADVSGYKVAKAYRYYSLRPNQVKVISGKLMDNFQEEVNKINGSNK